MKRLLTYILTITATLLCVSCSAGKTELDDIETYMNERPDSALQVLQSIDISSLTINEVNHYHFLLAQAKDKCFIDETDDSIMLGVVDHYKSKSDFIKLFRAYYYLGRIQQNAGRDTDAMYSYTEAEQLLDHISDDYTKGLLYAQMGALNHRSLDFNKALAAFNKAYDYYNRAGKIGHINYTKLDIGNTYYALEDYPQAEITLKEVLSWASYNNDGGVYLDALEVLCLVYQAENDISSLHDLLNGGHFTDIKGTLIINTAKAYDAALNGNYSEAHRLLEASWALTQNSRDSCMIYHMAYIVSNEQGNYKMALDNYECLFNLQDSIVRAALQKPLQSIRNDYFETKSAYNEQLLQNNKYRLYIVIVISIFTILSLVLVYRRRMILKDNQISAYMELADELKVSLAVTNDKLIESASDKEHQDKLLKEMSEQITMLFSRQFALLDKLSNTYYETHGSSRDQDAIYHLVKNEIENLTTDKKHIAQLERIVNEYKGDVMTIIRSEMNNLNEMDYRLLCYLFAGFSAKAISVFTGDSTANIYMKKGRIKGKISRLSPEIASYILERLA